MGNDRSAAVTGGRRLLGPLAAGAVLLVETLVGLADVKRPVFIAVSVVAALLTLGLAIWYFKSREIGRAAAACGGFVLVLTLAWAGAPESTSTARVGAPGPKEPAPSYDSNLDEVVVEEPSEAESLFSRAIASTTPWYNDVLDLYGSATAEDAEGEAALSGAWWALADWCIRERHGSEGRCYDLAGVYVAEEFDRDPRTISSETWFGAGAVGSILTSAYDITAKYIKLNPSGPIPELVRDRPGIDWDCEPSCTAGAARK